MERAVVHEDIIGLWHFREEETSRKIHFTMNATDAYSYARNLESYRVSASDLTRMRDRSITERWAERQSFDRRDVCNLDIGPW